MNLTRILCLGAVFFLSASPAFAEEPTAPTSEPTTEAAPPADYDSGYAACVEAAGCAAIDDDMGMCEVDCCEEVCPQVRPTWLEGDEWVWPDDCECGQRYGEWE